MDRPISRQYAYFRRNPQSRILNINPQSANNLSICKSTNLPIKRRLTSLRDRAPVEALDAQRWRFRSEELVVLARKREAATAELHRLRKRRNGAHIPAEVVDCAF